MGWLDSYLDVLVKYKNVIYFFQPQVIRKQVT
jgi:hypothetical protein